LSLILLGPAATVAQEPPNPFGSTATKRSDAIDGVVELSNGKRVRGKIYMTRGHSLRIFDGEKERFRDVPLNVIKQVDCIVEKEWEEKEWRFKENANDEKIFTGRTYPTRIYVHVIKLKRGDAIRGPLDALIYVQPERKADQKPAGRVKPVRFILHKRDKGEFGERLKDLIYVKRIVIGQDAHVKPTTHSP